MDPELVGMRSRVESGEVFQMGSCGRMCGDGDGMEDARESLEDEAVLGECC